MIELEGIFVLPLAPRWVRHSYLSKEATTDPLYLWVISAKKVKYVIVVLVMLKNIIIKKPHVHITNVKYGRSKSNGI